MGGVISLSTYDVNLFCHRISVDPVFRSAVLNGSEQPWNESGLDPVEIEALRSGDVGLLYRRGADAFLLHQLSRFQVEGLTPKRYAASMKYGRLLPKD